jgi:predicted short-subunit dehydrogenase-like oxidoreductase (DUF2520 family)
MEEQRIIIIGPGRAGGSLGLAAQAAGHRVVAVVPGPSGRVPPPLVGVVHDFGSLPAADLLLICTRDEGIAGAVQALADETSNVAVVAHCSGFTSVRLLAPLAGSGTTIGSLHPLQTLPDPVTGAGALAGAWAAVTGPASPRLSAFAASLGMKPFGLADEDKAIYHAAASSAANFVVEALAVAEDLFASRHLPFEALEPLVGAIVANVFRLGSGPALTGPVARGDVATVRGQLAAVGSLSPGLAEQYRLLVEALATRVGRPGVLA